MAIKILVADDYALFRQGLAALLNQEPDMRCVAEAADGEEAVRLALSLKPDVAILELYMERINGFEAARIIVGELPETRVLALSMHKELEHVRAMLQAGASGYVLKQDAFAELAAAIRAVFSGESWISAACAKIAGNTNFPLSERESQVIAMIAEGFGYEAIAAQLGASVKTVETYRERAARKLGAHVETALANAANSGASKSEA